MLPSPWSLGFVLGTVAGALLVPGCRPQDGSSRPSESEIGALQFTSSRVIPDQDMVVLKARETRTEVVGDNDRR